MTADRVGGTRDRSWGVRPLSGGTPAAPSTDVPGIFWLWSPLRLDDGTHERLELTPVGRVHMRGAGYTHLERGHGSWHGELDVAGEELVHADVDPWDLTGLHVQHVVRVSGDATGAGVLEQLHLGPHAPPGLTGFVDPPG